MKKLIIFAMALIILWAILANVIVPADAEGYAVYIVQPGDYLARIAARELGDSNRWNEIVDLTNEYCNTDTRLHCIDNPAILGVGWGLAITVENPEPPIEPPPIPEAHRKWHRWLLTAVFDNEEDAYNIWQLLKCLDVHSTYFSWPEPLPTSESTETEEVKTLSVAPETNEDNGTIDLLSAGVKTIDLPSYVEYWDPRLTELGVRIVPFNASPGQRVWRLVRAEFRDPSESGGNHNVYYQVFDSLGRPQVGKGVILSWPDGSTMRQTDENGRADIPIYAGYNPATGGGPYTASTVGGDSITGLGLPFKQHVCFRFTFAEMTTEETPSPPPPTPPSGSCECPSLDQIRAVVIEALNNTSLRTQ